jgi:small subunit ribosomal protein S17e
LLILDRVRRISEEIVQKYPGAFGTDYQANKDELNKVAVVHSKMLRNKIAGYITKINSKAAAKEEEEGEKAVEQPAE